MIEVKQKFVLCTGCKKKQTINFTNKNTEKEMKCTYCGQITIHNLKLKYNESTKN